MKGQWALCMVSSLMQIYEVTLFPIEGRSSSYLRRGFDCNIVFLMYYSQIMPVNSDEDLVIGSNQVGVKRPLGYNQLRE